MRDGRQRERWQQRADAAKCAAISRRPVFRREKADMVRRCCNTYAEWRTGDVATKVKCREQKELRLSSVPSGCSHARSRTARLNAARRVDSSRSTHSPAAGQWLFSATTQVLHSPIAATSPTSATTTTAPQYAASSSRMRLLVWRSDFDRVEVHALASAGGGWRDRHKN